MAKLLPCPFCWGDKIGNNADACGKRKFAYCNNSSECPIYMLLIPTELWSIRVPDPRLVEAEEENAYLKKALADYGICYDSVSKKCIEQEEYHIVDKQMMDLLDRLKEAVKEIRGRLSNGTFMIIENILYKHIPEVKVEYE